MDHIEKLVYTAKAHTTGGREGGASRTSDGRLDVRLTNPGAPGDGTNPEQLFAVGWSACFLSAIKLTAAKSRVTLPEDVAIDIEVDLGTVPGAFALAVRMNIVLPGMEPTAAETLVHRAHEICPYSRATRGNIDVSLTVSSLHAVQA